MNLKNELRDYINACKLYRRDLQDGINDLTFLEKRGNKIRYAVDFSEIHSYILPEQVTPDFYIFADDLESTAGIIEYLSLRRLFEELNQKLILLPPYAIELETFLLRYPESAFSKEMVNVLNIFFEAHHIVEQSGYKHFSALIEQNTKQGKHLREEDYDEMVDFLQQHAPRILLLLEQRVENPVSRIQSLFEHDKLENLPELVPNIEDTGSETATFKRWKKELLLGRGERAEFSSHLDSVAADLIEKANYVTKDKNTKLLLVTRSPHMLQIDQEHPFEGLWSNNGDRLLRHPRIFYLLHGLNGRSQAELKQEFIARLDTVELFLEAAESDKLEYLADDQERVLQIERFLEKIKSSWRSSEALDAFLGESLASKRPRGKYVSEAAIIRAFESVRNSEKLNGLIVARLKDLADSLEKEHSVLGFYIQNASPRDQDLLSSATATSIYPNEKYVFRTKLQAVPFTFQFYSEAAAKLFEVLGSLESYSWEDAFRAFTQNLEQYREFDYDRLLAMAVVFGTVGKWQLAEDYCEHAIQFAQQDTLLHEANYFLAICMRKKSNSLKRYIRGVSLIDNAISSKRRHIGDSAYADPRYLKEKGTLILTIRLEYKNKSAKYQAKEGLSLLESALQYCENDELLKIQIVNNRLFYLIESGTYGELPSRAATEVDYNLLTGLQQAIEPNEDHWPPFVLDTLAWAEFKLYNPQDEEARSRIRKRFITAENSKDLKYEAKSRREVVRHHEAFEQGAR